MNLYVKDALRRVGEAIPFQISENLPAQQYNGRQLQFISPTVVNGTYTFDGKAFSVEGKAEVSVQSVCARCDEAFEEKLSFLFEERLIRQSAEDDEESYSYTGDTIGLNDAIMDNLFLQLPLVSVCREDCKGLCPVCGKNRNFEQCDCYSAVSDNAFSVLKERQNEYKEV